MKVNKPTVNLRSHGPQAAANRPSLEDAVEASGDGAEIFRPPGESVIVTDARGRQITIKKLRPLDNWRLLKLLGSEHSRNSVMFNYGAIVAAVSAIDGQHELCVTLRELENLIGRLDEDGMTAVADGYQKHFGVEEAAEYEPETIKNSPGAE
jgi:hypothetical protein